MSKSTLMTHNPKIGARPVTLKELEAMPLPKPLGPRHAPVAHVELVRAVEKELKSQLGATVTARKLAVGKGLEGGVDAAMFGVLTLAYGEHDDFTAAVGLRHAVDLSMAIQMVAGMEVFVCDNMVLRGDVIMLRRKHTTNLSLAEEVAAGVAKFKAHYSGLEGMVSGLKKAKLTDAAAKALMHDAFVKTLEEAEPLPLRLLPAVSGEYFKPTRKEFEARTEWSLHNAFTEVLKQLPLVTRIRHTEAVGRVFGMAEAA